jgi:hypothetical protein
MKEETEKHIKKYKIPNKYEIENDKIQNHKNIVMRIEKERKELESKIPYWYEE